MCIYIHINVDIKYLYIYMQRLYEGAGGEGHNASVSSGAKAGIHI
jgi:hypothetical protein